jgi:type I restriction-modification system DNA methylase subunit
MIKQGKSLNQICSERGLVESTIIGHLEKFVIEGKITAKELLPLVEGSLKKALPEIHRTFRQMNTTSLSPVYEYLNGKYSYRDLKIARIVLPPGTIKG